MKKLFAALLSAALLIGALAGCGTAPAEPAKETTLEKIQRQGYITVATDAAWAPFEFIGEGGEVIGCDIALAQDIADALGVELKILNAAFDSLSTYVLNGEAELIMAAMSITPERQETMAFSDPYTESVQYIIVAQDNNDVTAFEDMAGYKLGTHLGTTGDFMVVDQIDLPDGALYGTGASYAQYKALTDACLDLKAGNIQAVVCDMQLAESLVTVNDGLKCFPAAFRDKAAEPEYYGIAMAKGDDAFVAKINEIIKPIVESGKFNEYFVQYSEINAAML